MPAWLQKLLTWFKNLFVRVTTTPGEVYTSRERLIYTYWNGDKDVRVDPMVVYRKLMDVWPELTVDMRVANSESKDAGKAWDGQVEKVRKIFNLKTLDDGGLTDVESMQVLYDYWEWTQQLKKNSSPTATLPEATSPTSGSTTAAESPTPSTLDSGSTETGNSTGVPTPSSEASPSPTAS